MATKGPRERTRTIARATASSDSGLAQALQVTGEFFGGVSSRLQKEEIAKEAIRNEQAVESLGQAARENPELAREAARTGDFTQFLGTEFARRTVVQQAGAKMIGDTLAIADRGAFREGLENLPADGDANAFHAEFNKNQTEGMNPFAAHAYTAQVGKFAPQLIETRRKDIQNALIERSMKTVPASLRASLSIDGMLSPEGFDQLKTRHAVSMPGVFTKNMVTLNDSYNKELVRLASKSGPVGQLANTLLDRSGIINTMDPVEVSDIRAKSVSNSRRAWAEQHNDVITETDDAVTKWELDGKGDFKALSGIYIAFVSEALKFGSKNNEKFRLMKKRITNIFKENAEVFKAFRIWQETGTFPAMTDKTRDSAVKFAYSKGLREGVSLESDRGSSAENIDKRSGLIMGGGDGFKENLAILIAINDKSNMAMAKNHLKSGQPTMMFHALANIARREGLDKARNMRDVVGDGFKNDERGTDNHFSRRFATTAIIVGSDRPTQGAKGARDFLADFLSDLTDDEKEAAGIPEGTDLGSQTSQALYNDLLKKLNIASFISAQMPGDGDDQVAAILKASLKGEYEFNVDASGKGWATLRTSPRTVRDAMGHAVEGKPFGKESAERYIEWRDREEEFTGLNLDALSISEDDLTPVTGTRAVHNGIKGPIEYTLGTYTLPPEDAKLMAGSYRLDQTNEDGSVIATFIEPEDLDADTSVMVSTNTTVVYDAKLKRRRLRYVDRPDLQEEGWFVASLGAISAFFGLDVIDKEALIKNLSSLDSKQREAAQRHLLENDFAFWSDEKLQRMTTSRDPHIRKKSRDEIALRLDGKVQSTFKSKGLNAGTAPEFGEGQPTPDEDGMEALDTVLDNHLQEGVDKGLYQTVAVAAIDKLKEIPMEDKLDMVEGESMKSTFFEDMSQPAAQQFLTATSQFLEQREGFSSIVYNDATGGKYTIGDKGIPTVGIGYNLLRTNSAEELKSVGLDRTKLFAGKQTVSRDQARQLVEIVMSDLIVFMRKEFPDTPMEQHRWTALTSLAYNSRWERNRPTLIGPELRKFIKAQQWENAAQEIEFRSGGGVLPSQKRGILLRRAIEAALFRGVFEEGALGLGTDISGV